MKPSMLLAFASDCYCCVTIGHVRRKKYADVLGHLRVCLPEAL